MNAAERRVTYAEMLDWPEDGRQYEFDDGDVIVDPVAETIEVYALSGNAYQLRVNVRHDAGVTSPTLDGVTVETARVFC